MKKQINFMAQSKFAFIISAICIALSIFGIYHKGLDKGIDFVGGILVEVQSEQVEGQEDTDIRNRYYKDDGQRLLQRIEQDTGRKEDDGNHNQQQGVLLVVLLAPGPTLLFVFGYIAHWQSGIEFFQILFQ